MRALNIVVVLFLVFAVITADKSHSKEYSDNGCPEFERTLCMNTPSNKEREIFECYTDDDCDVGRKCCSNCNYSYKICTQTTLKENSNGGADERLKSTFCPIVKPCYTPLLYDIRYRCGSDENCQYGYKCCRSDCYIHKVCVIAVDQEGNEIPITSTSTIPDQTTSFKETPTKFHSTPEITESSGSGDGFTDDDDEDRKEKTTIRTTISSTRVTTATAGSTDDNNESSGSGDGFTDDDEDHKEKTTVKTITSTVRTTTTTLPSITTTPTTLFHPLSEVTKAGGSGDGSTDDTDESSGSGDGFTDDDEDRKEKTTVRTTTTTIPSTSTKSTTIFQPPLETAEASGSGDGSTDDTDKSSGSGDGFTDDDEDRKEKITLRTTTTTVPTTVRTTTAIPSTTTKATTLFQPPLERAEASGSGDGSTDDTDGSNGSGDGFTDDDEDRTEKTTIRTTVTPIPSTRVSTTQTTTLLHPTPKLTKSEGSGNGFTDDIDEFSGSGDGFTDDYEDHKQKMSSSTVSPTKTTILSTKSHFIDDITEASGSGDGFTDDDEDHNQKTPTHLITLKATTPRELLTTISPTSTPILKSTTFIRISTKLPEASGSGDGSTVDHEDEKHTIESTGSGDGSISDDEDYTSSVSTFKSIHTTASTMLHPIDIRVETSDDKDTNKHTPLLISTKPHEHHRETTTKLTTPSQISTKKHAETVLDEGSGSGDWSTDDETKTSYTRKPFSEIHSKLTTLLTLTSKPTHVLIEGSGSLDDEDFTTYVTSKEWKSVSTGKPNNSDNKNVHVLTTEKSIPEEILTSIEGSGNSDDEDLVFLPTDSTRMHATNLSSLAEFITTINYDNSIKKEGKHFEENKPATNKKENEDFSPDRNEITQITTNTASTAKDVNLNKDTKEDFDITNKPKQIPKEKEHHPSPNSSHPTGLPESSLIDALHSLKEEDNFSGDDENYDDEDNIIFKHSNI